MSRDPVVVVEVSSEVEPVRPSYERFSARIKWPESEAPLNPQKLGDVTKVVEVLRNAGVPADAYFQTNWPYTFANWERPPR